MWWLVLITIPGIPAQQASNPTDGYSIASLNLQSTVNLQLDPCDDFYEYACGNFAKNYPIPNDSISRDYFEVLDEKVRNDMTEVFESPAPSSSRAINMAKTIYSSCMNETQVDYCGPKVAQEELRSIGSWPILDGTLRSRENCSWIDFDLTQTLIKAYRLRAIDVFFYAQVTIDPKDSKRRIMSLDQGPLGMGSRDNYLNTEQFADQIEAYKNLLIKWATLFSEDTGKDVNPDRIEMDVEDVIDFETKLANISTPPDERNNLTELYHLVKFNELQGLFPMINWKRYFFYIGPNSSHSYFSSNPDILVYEPAYFKRLEGLLQNTPNRVIANYIFFRFLNGLDLQLGTRYDDAEQDFNFVMEGRKEKSPRRKECMTIANTLLSYAVGSMYVRKSFDSASKEATILMIIAIKNEFKTMLLGSNWMDPVTKKTAEEKLSKLDYLVGYPDFILDDLKLDAFYKELKIIPNDTFIYAYGKAMRFLVDYNYNKLGKPVDRNEFAVSVAQINAFYQPSYNNIVIPAAILQPPFFHKDYPKALNYGGIGAVVGHELTHGFDTTGSQFDAEGSLSDWWDASTAEKFTTRSNCIIEQYENITVPDTNMTINGNLTVGENIADNGGVKEAFAAYKTYLEQNGEERKIPGLEKFTGEQLFFMGYSQVWCGHTTLQAKIQDLLLDVHSPMKYRVNVPLSNFPSFSTVFNCSLGSRMNPIEKCSVW